MRAKILKLLAEEGELSAKEIAIKLSISLSETYRLLRDLIRMKILERKKRKYAIKEPLSCLLYTSPSPRDLSTSRMPSSA